MIKKIVRKWLGIADEQCPVDTFEEDIRRNNIISSTLNESAPAITAYKINNGYIVRTMDKSLINKTMAMPQFTYCKDAKDIAEHIIAESARQTLGVGSQLEMFGKTGDVIASNLRQAGRIV